NRNRVLVAILAALALVLGTGGVARADPDGGTTQSLVEALATAAQGYYAAQAVLAASQQRQAEIQHNLDLATTQRAERWDRISNSAAPRYIGGSIGLFNGLISTDASKSDVLDGAAVGQYMVQRDDMYIQQYSQLKSQSEQQQTLLQAELK